MGGLADERALPVDFAGDPINDPDGNIFHLQVRSLLDMKLNVGL